MFRHVWPERYRLTSEAILPAKIVLLIFHIYSISARGLFQGEKKKKQKQKNNNKKCAVLYILTVTTPKLVMLTFTTLMANSADDKSVIFFLFFPKNRIRHFMQIVSKKKKIFFLFFPENRIWHFMQIVSIAWNVKSCFLWKVRKIFQYLVCWKFYPEC